ncbi:MAG: Cytochrome-c peroxidase [Bacteroidota bacterium]|nr:Cytochrome-c peroxidase [Bacteroidota bacterium]
MKRSKLLAFIFVASLLVLASCLKNDTLAKRVPQLPAVPYDYTAKVIIPQGNPWGNGGNGGDNTPPDNVTTNAGAALGRVLFYDRVFSLNNSISCSSCHKQQFAFSDNVDLSNGFDGSKTLRNALPVFNQHVNSAFFWDGRAATLEQQSLMPVKNHIEMGMEKMDNLAIKLKSVSYYPALFKAAFGSEEITAVRVADALAQFMRSMRSFNSKFDQGGTMAFANFTDKEKDGMQIFTQSRCNNCHGGQNLSGNFGSDWANTGLDASPVDKGKGAITGFPQQNGVFRVPSLRNIGLTGPYMHDGRYKTLDEVIDHYNNGVQASPNLDVRLTTGGWGIDSSTTKPVNLNLNTSQKESLKAFLLTLTDYQFTSDPKFSDPFK